MKILDNRKQGKRMKYLEETIVHKSSRPINQVLVIGLLNPLLEAPSIFKPLWLLGAQKTYCRNHTPPRNIHLLLFCVPFQESMTGWYRPIYIFLLLFDSAIGHNSFTELCSGKVAVCVDLRRPPAPFIDGRATPKSARTANNQSPHAGDAALRGGTMSDGMRSCFLSR